MIAPRRLGSTGPAAFPLAPGCMGMSGMYGPADEKTSVANIHAFGARFHLPSNTRPERLLCKSRVISLR
jgi:hypothetical protein